MVGALEADSRSNPSLAVKTPPLKLARESAATAIASTRKQVTAHCQDHDFSPSTM